MRNLLNSCKRKCRAMEKGRCLFMKKGLLKSARGLFCMVLATAMALTGVQFPKSGQKGGSMVAIAEAASTTGRVPMWAYMKSGSGKLITYTTNALNSSTGYIEPGDYCKILAFYSNGSVKVSYPTSKGSRTAYAAMNGFMASTGFDTRTRTLGKKLTAYRRSTGNSTIGTVYASDQVIVVGTSNGRTQVQYPCSGGFKLGWVAGTYSANTGSNPQGCIDSVVSTAEGRITVAGWAFDRDSLGSSLQVHVYVGGPAGSGAPGYVVTANAYRPDVNKVYPGVGNYHGFNSTICVSKRGSQTIYIYAINVGGGNTNPLLGTKSVNIRGGNANASTSNSSTSFQMPLANARCTWRSYSNWSWASKSGSGSRVYHLGIDIAGSSDNVMATATGIVAKCGYNSANGNYVVLKHTISGKTVYSFYAHLASYNVRNGATVAKGSKIGVVGNTGSASRGKHLHFAMTDTLWSGSYYGYATYFSGNKTTYAGVTYYNPIFVIQNNRLP